MQFQICSVSVQLQNFCSYFPPLISISNIHYSSKFNSPSSSLQYIFLLPIFGSKLYLRNIVFASIPSLVMSQFCPFHSKFSSRYTSYLQFSNICSNYFTLVLYPFPLRLQITNNPSHCKLPPYIPHTSISPISAPNISIFLPSITLTALSNQ